MPAFDRNRWKAAQEIAATLTAGQHVPRALTLPTRTLFRLQELAARQELAQQRQWHGAAAQTQDLFHRTLWQLQAEVTLLLQEHPRRERQPQNVRPADIYRELTALSQEFPQVELDLRNTRMRVTTPRIELNDFDFGPFELVWNWSSVEHWDDLRVVALEPRYPQDRTDVTHPHVLNECLCEGAAGRPLERALQDGRLCEYFLIVQQTLRTYNAQSPYVALENWDGVACQSCSVAIREDQEWSCEQCGDRLCSDCIGRCYDCDGDVCHSCLRSCPACLGHFCAGCWPTERRLSGALCPACQTSAQETQHENPTTSASSPTPSAAAIHAVCLGQVGVPA